jgi:predicted permease
VLSDCRFGLRQLRRTPSFTAIAVATLALGIGANTAIFSVVQGVVLAPLPYKEPDRLVLVWLYNRTLKNATWLSYSDFLDWQRTARSFQQMAAFTQQNADLTSPGTPEHLNGKRVSWGFFSTLGVKLAVGHEFTRQEDVRGGAPVVVISYRLWRDRFAKSLQALGKSVTLDGVDYTIAGVLPPDFRFWSDADVYLPLGQGDPLQLGDRTTHNMACIARLRTKVSIGQAQAEMNALQENLDRLYPTEERGLGTEIAPLKQQLTRNVRGTLLLLLGAVGVVLLIACANVANLLLARSAARRREFAIRSAVGANGTRIVRQVVTESVILALIGAVFGLAVARWGVSPLLAAVPGSLPRSENISLNVPVLFFAFGVSILTAVVFVLAPALKISKLDPQTSLKEGGRTSTSAHQRAQSILVIVQMALTLVLLAGAGLLFRTVQHLWAVDPGFNTRHVVTFKAGLAPGATTTAAKMRIGYQQLMERIREIPGVQAAELTTLVPLSGQDNALPFWLGSREPASMAEAPRALSYSIGPDYLKVMGIPLLRGRFFTLRDTTESAHVIVIDSNMARAYFPDKDAVGQTITFVHVGAFQVIGVVGHVKHWA